MAHRMPPDRPDPSARVRHGSLERTAMSDGVLKTRPARQNLSTVGSA